MAVNTTHANNTTKARIQLKSDTETNWNKSVLQADGGTKLSGTSFVPLLGELIVYLADDTHPFSRLKIGDGETNVVRLPFIDAGTINGDTIPSSEVRVYENRNAFPSPGEENKLYVAYDTQKIYCYHSTSGYTMLSNFTYTIGTTQVSQITNWNTGTLTRISENGGIVTFRNGSVPTLNYTGKTVVNSVTKE